MDASYDYSTINDRMLGHGTPIQVKQNQRVIFRIVNASATVTHWLALAGHETTVVAMDGNPGPESDQRHCTSPGTGRTSRMSSSNYEESRCVDPGGNSRRHSARPAWYSLSNTPPSRVQPKWINPPEG